MEPYNRPSMKASTKIFLVVCGIVLIYFLFIKDKMNTTDNAKEIISIDQDDSVEATWYERLVKDNIQFVNADQKNYYIILDASGSMSGERISDAKIALKKFLTFVPSKANVGLLAFDSNGIKERAELGSDRTKFNQIIDKIQAGGSTPLGESMAIAFKKLALQAKKQRGYGEYNLIVITDGEATDESEMQEVVDSILQNSPIVIHTIGFHIGSGHSLNQPGKIYYKSARNIDELSKGLEEVLAESKKFVVDKF